MIVRYELHRGELGSSLIEITQTIEVVEIITEGIRTHTHTRAHIHAYL